MESEIKIQEEVKNEDLYHIFDDCFNSFCGV